MSDASYPDGLFYNEEHDWARVDGENATFGITWYAQDSLGEVVFYSPAAVGTAITKGGEVTEVNDALEGSESSINDDPYGEGWLIKVRLSDPSQVESLMDAAAYQAYLETL
jgi:glycine cleavage system H protein